MAKFLPILGQLSGSIGDNTWSHNKGGPYVRKRGIPAKIPTAAQLAVRAIMASLSSQWSSALSSTERGEWNNWASTQPLAGPLGNTYLRSGQQAFVGLNARLVLNGGSFVALPPTTVAPPGQVTLGGTISAGSQLWTVATTPTPATSNQVIWQSLPLHLGVQSRFAEARRIAQMTTPATADTLGLVIPVQAGDLVTIWAQPIDATGQTSPPLRTDIVVGA
jgi:hypothetical protein